MPRGKRQHPEGKHDGEVTRHGNDRAFRSMEMIIVGIEKAEGAASSADVLMLCKMYRSKELTITAQRELIQKLGREKVEAAASLSAKTVGAKR